MREIPQDLENLEKPFKGLDIDMGDIGLVYSPLKLQEASLGKDIVDLPYESNEGKRDYAIYINKPELEKVLLETNGVHIFRAMQGRFVVLAKVNNIHLPFYISSSGTSGKRQGEWYPFFGYTGSWLVKGEVKSNGDMYYHPEIKKVQDILNKNLVLPASYISPRGKFGTNLNKRGVEPQNVLFDINQHLKYQNYMFTDYADYDQAYVEHMTGYMPVGVENDGGDSAGRWVRGVVKQIR